MRKFTYVFLMMFVLASPAVAQLDFHDDFEPAGVDGSVWLKWPEADEKPFSDNNMNHTDDPEATWSARAEEADPWGYAMYADFGTTTGAVYAEVWIFDSMDDDGTDPDRPVSNMLALVGASETPESWTDYLQLGVVAWYDDAGLSETYSVRTKYRDQAGGTYVDTGFPRRYGWIKLAIAADAPADGGQVRFYIDDQLVMQSYRMPGVALQYVRLGVNFKSYDYFWYDDVSVTDVLPSDELAFFDADLDGDVDQVDFSVFQTCYTSASASYDNPVCWRFDPDSDGDVDTNDFEAFEACASGPGIPANVSCDN